MIFELSIPVTTFGMPVSLLWHFCESFTSDYVTFVAIQHKANTAIQDKTFIYLTALYIPVIFHQTTKFSLFL